MATGAAATVGTQVAASLLNGSGGTSGASGIAGMANGAGSALTGFAQALDSSPQSGATSGDAKGGTTGNFSFGNVNFGGTQSNSGGINWLVVGGVVVAVAVFYFISKD